jgi:hypothetical protein
VPRFVSLTVAFIALVALISAGAYVLARWYALDGVADLSAVLLKWSLYAIAAGCAYACLVGVYHTILSVTGLDREREDP